MLSGDDGSQNMFVYQSTFGMLQLQKDNDIGYVPGWEWKGVYSSTFSLIYTAFLHRIKRFGYKMRIKFDKEHLVLEKQKITQPKL